VGSKEAELERGASSALVLDEDLGIVEDLAIFQHIGAAVGGDPHGRTVHHPVEKVEMMDIFFQNRSAGERPRSSASPGASVRGIHGTTSVADRRWLRDLDHLFHFAIKTLETHLVTDLEDLP
jgi:hypothetical protein